MLNQLRWVDRKQLQWLRNIINLTGLKVAQLVQGASDRKELRDVMIAKKKMQNEKYHLL